MNVSDLPFQIPEQAVPVHTACRLVRYHQPSRPSALLVIPASSSISTGRWTLGVIPHASDRAGIAGVTNMITSHRSARRIAAARSTITAYLCRPVQIASGGARPRLSIAVRNCHAGHRRTTYLEFMSHRPEVRPCFCVARHHDGSATRVRRFESRSHCWYDRN